MCVNGEKVVEGEGAREVFNKRSEFEKFWKRSGFQKNKEFYVNQALELLNQKGFWCEFNGVQFASHQIEIRGENYRETLAAGGFNSRQRAINHEVFRLIGSQPKFDIKIFSPEAVTEFALAYRGVYPKFLGTEYSEKVEIHRRLYPIPIEDLNALSFPNAAFNLVIAGDVFEHIPDIDQGLSELSRILKEDGGLVATFPFHPFSDIGIEKARLVNDVIQYVSEPEYHGNPLEPEGSLVFQVPGWDILKRVKKAGFRSASMVWHYSPQLGVLSNDIVGVFVLIAQK